MIIKIGRIKYVKIEGMLSKSQCNQWNNNLDQQYHIHYILKGSQPNMN